MFLDTKPTLHVLFSMPAASSVRQILQQGGCHDRVIGFPDDLSFGPISPPSAKFRVPWIENWLGHDFREVLQQAETFWAAALSRDVLPIAWVCRNDASDYAAFLEFVWRIGDAPFRVIDTTCVQFTHTNNQSKTFTAHSLGIVTPTQMADAKLLERQIALQPFEIENYRNAWQQLRTQNAPLRVVEEARLVSKPINFFDNAILSRVTGEWQKAALIIGSTMADLFYDPPPCHRVSDMLLWARIGALGEEGTLDLSDHDSDMHGTLVRRPSKASPNP